MQSDKEFQSLISNLITDVQEISVLWQLGVLFASLGLAWFLQRQFRQGIPTPTSASRTLNISVNSMNRLMFPILALALIILGKWALHHWYSTHILNIVIPLLFALALVRAAVYMLRRIFSSQEWLPPWERFIGWAVWIGLVLYITGLMPEILALFDDISFHVGKQRLSVLLIVQGILAFTISMLVALWLARSFEARIMDTNSLEMNQRVIL
ncbi:MAG: mechanosensitive ion channel protein MscS, partial [Nitrosospira sp.]